MSLKGAFMRVRRMTFGLLVLAVAAPAAAQQDPQEESSPYVYEDQVVVTASRSEQQLVNAPAAMSIISSSTIQNSPSSNMGDLLRAVPGTNVTQLTARDVNITSRGATSTLATSQLALVDGRSIYLDFFGMVMWDLVPTNPNDIRQIEVIRGPASAVWGANAMTGVVNVITRTPREIAGTSTNGTTAVTIGVGTFNRNVTGRSQDAGTLWSINASHAHAVNDRLAFKVSGGYLTQDPLPRPTGTIPNAFNTPYPPYTNTGTSQPKVDGRVDYQLENKGTLTFSGGVAGTEGIIHSGIGPFDIQQGSRLGYGSARYQKGGQHVAFFTNLLDGDARNQLTRGVTGQPIALAFKTNTFDIEAGDSRALTAHHLLTYGGNFRRNNFDISLAPLAEDRSEGGGYLQDEIFINDHLRWVVGGRVDKFSSIDDAVFSPRTTFMIKPDASQTFRVSFNRAFRAPSLVNNHIDVTIIQPITLPTGPFVFPVRATGNPDLEQETMTAYEIGYTGTLKRRATVNASLYWNNTENGIYFTPIAFYSPAAPPPGWPLPPAFVPANQLTSRFTYLNFGTIKDKGIELGVDAQANRYVNVFANYSYQWMPEIEDFPAGTGINDINWPSKNRFNTGLDFHYSRFLGNLSVNYTDTAYWQDVLDVRFAGATDAFTLVNGTFGVKWMGDRLVTSVKGVNLGNTEAMQHIFGDVLKRQIVGEARFTF
jgi:outer membrane receptor for ferrienterochelin and colicin